MMGGRNARIAKSAKSFPPQTGSTTTCKLTAPKHPDCAKLADAADKAALAEHTYGARPDGTIPIIPSNYEKVDPANLPKEWEIDLEMVEPDGESFKAEIFKLKDSSPPSYVVAFRGTRGPTWQDWWQNFKQGVGLKSESYDRAIQLAKKMAKATNGQVSFAGHSLGGGLASAAAHISKKNATTFNSAGLNQDTVDIYPKVTSNVDAYYVPGEVLSGTQDNRKMVLGGLTAVAHAINPILGRVVSAVVLQGEIREAPVFPRAYGVRHPLPVVAPSGKVDNGILSTVDKHGMDWVINGIKTKQRQLGCIESGDNSGNVVARKL
jgi:hypothetical protein